MDAFHTQVARIADDVKKGTFANYQPFELVPGFTLESVEDALGFNVLHEGSHIGIVISIRRLLGVGKS